MTITTISLDKLTPSKANVRKTARTEGIEALAASIHAHGLLQNLTVQPAGDKFEVLAGGRRLAALKLLVKEKKLEAGHPVPCQIHEGEDATEISLAENTIRVQMHPADQFEAFKKLADEGMSVEDIAARFGLAPKTVMQRLKLAVVSPKLMAEYRAGKMDLEQLMAFTVSDDRKAQEAAWFDAPRYARDPSDIRARLMHENIRAEDKRVKFIGIGAYTKAGGAIVRDLFDDKNKGWLTDSALVNRLVAEKLEKLAEQERKDGWKWVEIVPDLDYRATQGMARITPVLSADDQKAIDDLQDQADDIEVDEESHQTLVDQLETIGAKATYANAEKAMAGVMIGIGYDGKTTFEHGLVKREDMKAVKAAQAEKGGKTDDAPAPENPGLSAKLIEDLTAHLTAGLQVELARNPKVALAAVVHHLAMDMLYSSPWRRILDIRGAETYLKTHAEGIAQSAAIKEIEKQRKAWEKRLPKAAEKLWPWLMEQNQKTQLELLAFCAALTVDALHIPKRQEQSKHVPVLAAALKLDMRTYWQPTTASYFGRIPKKLMLEAVTEATGQPRADALQRGWSKKDALASACEKELADTQWLPAILCGHEGKN